ncbi:hypothetical protein V8G54_001460, partial [Vigna mungo]
RIDTRLGVTCEVHKAEVVGGLSGCMEEHGDEFPGGGGRVGVGYFEDIGPFDDDGILDTEVMVLAAETQVFDGDDNILENEAMNLASETQALGDGETQLLDEVCESDRMQVLDNVDDDELSVDNDNGEIDSRKGKSWQRNRSERKKVIILKQSQKQRLQLSSIRVIVVDFTLTVVPIQIFMEGIMFFAVEVLGR